MEIICKKAMCYEKGILLNPAHKSIPMILIFMVSMYETTYKYFLFNDT